jgi:hypothetical protein
MVFYIFHMQTPKPLEKKKLSIIAKGLLKHYQYVSSFKH